MAQSDRRFHRKHLSFVTFAVSTAAVTIAAGAIAYQPILDVHRTDRDSGSNRSGGSSPRFSEADRASVVQLANEWLKRWLSE